MGVSIDIWRARIGTHKGSRQLTSKEMHSILLDATNIKFFMAALTICLVIGNVELNPGPNQLKCPQVSCNFVALNISAVAYHQQIHKAEKNFFFKCPLVLCKNKIFTTYSGLCNHIKDLHPAKNSSNTPSASTLTLCNIANCDFSFGTRSELCRHYNDHLKKNTVIKCFLCKRSGNFSDGDKFLNHLNESHSESIFQATKCNIPRCQGFLSSFQEACDHFQCHLADNVKVICPLQKGCHISMFSDDQIFRTHLSVKHSGWKEDSAPLQQQATTKQASSEAHGSSTSAQGTSAFLSQSMDCGDSVGAEGIQDQDDESEDPITSDMFFNHIGQFYLMLLSEQLLPHSTVDTISQGLKFMSELVQHQFGVAISKELKKRSMKEEEIIDVVNSVMSSDVFYAAHHKKSPGPTFTSVHLRKNYVDTLKYVKPIEVRLDNDTDDGAVAHLIPPADVLENLLEDASVQEYIDQSFRRQPDPNVLQDYTDGSACRCKGLTERIDIHVFQDAFNAANPIGSAKNKHKFNGTYWCIGNLPSYIRAKVNSINLAYLVNHKYMQDTASYGPRKCFKPIVDKFKKLEEGGILYKGRRIPVVVQFYCGDSLGAHEVGGFIGQFSSTYFCRFCEIKRNDFHRNPCLVRAFRTKESYYAALRQLEDIQTRRPAVVSFQGVKENSVLHELDDFHVCDHRLPPCVAHDVFEGGVADYDLSEIIYRLVGDGWFSYPDLKNLLSAFRCLGSDKGNKPAPIKDTGTKLGGHAVQNWALVRLLPFIIQGCIKDPAHEMWKLYLKLKQLLEYVCAPSYSQEDLVKLKEITQEYMADRKRLLEKPVKPKHHFLMHYADLIPFVGPIIYLFTLRFEAKHQFFKRVAKASKNFINLGKTLAKRHQIWMAYLTAGSVLSKGSFVKKSLSWNPEMYAGKVKDILSSGIFSNSSVNCSKIICDGLGYKTGMYLLLDKCTDFPDCLNIGKVEVIVQSNEGVIFILNKYKATLWQDYGVYRIEDTSFDTECILQSELKYPVEQAVYTFNDELCFSLKHFIH